MRTTIDLPALACLIDDNGSFSISNLAKYGCIAAASDGKNTLAMLRRKPEESFIDLLTRLDAAIVKAAETQTCIDEVNPLTSYTRPASTTTRKTPSRSRR